MADPDKLRQLAAWYRDFAERADNPWVWEARLQLAEDLEREAIDSEQRVAQTCDESAEPERPVIHFPGDLAA